MTQDDAGPLEDKVLNYRAGAIHYLGNAREFLRQQEFAKASEFIWGAMAQAIKAVAASKGFELRQHRELWDYARELARELNDPSMFQDFRQANFLHSNFYEAGLPAEEVIDSVETVGATVGKLLSLLPEEAK
jgi:Archaeal PaREP1/PaREP8 family